MSPSPLGFVTAAILAITMSKRAKTAIGAQWNENLHQWHDCDLEVIRLIHGSRGSSVPMLVAQLSGTISA
jgi:hypothetical protein